MAIRTHCKICDRLFDKRGLARHMQMHDGTADFLGGGLQKKEKKEKTEFKEKISMIQGSGIAADPVSLSAEKLSIAYNLFPSCPLQFNALAFMLAAESVKDGHEKLDNLKTALVYLDLKIQTLGGWDSNSK